MRNRRPLLTRVIVAVAGICWLGVLGGSMALAAETAPAPFRIEPVVTGQSLFRFFTPPGVDPKSLPRESSELIRPELGFTEQIASLPDGTLQAQIRREYFGPDNLGPMNTRSSLQTWNVDCKGPRLRITAMQIFQLNNLGGLSDARDDA